ncbi:MAG: hypothetical protein NTV81_02385 [Candidatus Komeilibacteria bacterium]|nr:hypothetical protein [Candidatus Komeilibacteria bacterium]
MDASRRSFLNFLGLGTAVLVLKPLAAVAALGQRFEVERRRLEVLVTAPSPGNITVAELSRRSGIGLDLRRHPSGVGNFVYAVNGHLIDPDQAPNQEDGNGWMFALSRAGGGWDWNQGRGADRVIVARGQRVFWQPRANL